MSLQSMKGILAAAHWGKYAVGGFNVNNLEFLQAIIRAGERKSSPLIIQLSEGALDYMDLEYAGVLCRQAAQKTALPVALHLDHGSSLETIIRVIRAGFSSVMIDASSYPFSENVALTKRTVEMAQAVDVSVEAELGKIGEGDDQGGLTDPREAVEFVRKTGVDALAVAIGTVHGPYQGEPQLDFNLLEELNHRLDLPLVLHGASGLSATDLKKCISLGISKVNINTDFQQTFTARVREVLQEDSELYDPRKILGPGRQAMVVEVERKIDLLGSAERAQI